MSEPTQEQIFQWLADMISAGKIKQDRDGSWHLDEDLHGKLTKLINERPELYSQIFPDRVN